MEQQTTLKTLRKEAGLLQKDVAKALGISVANYSKKENGVIKVSVAETETLSKVFQKTVEQIFLLVCFKNRNLKAAK